MPHSKADGMARGRERVFVEAVAPAVDAGAHPVKRVTGSVVEVSADLIADGHDVVRGRLVVHAPDGSETRHWLRPLGNDRHSASFVARRLGRHHYAIEAWVDSFATWRRGFEKKWSAGQDLELELLEGARLVRDAAGRSTGETRSYLEGVAQTLAGSDGTPDDRAALATSAALLEHCEAHPDTQHATCSKAFPLVVDPKRAEFSSWYEMFPRSTGDAGQHGTFQTAKRRLAYAAEMGFDVVYLPPIHPIGETFRKGRNNAPSAEPGDVGSPWAIGGRAGGHKSTHPDLGSLDDFDELVQAARALGVDIALDVALQVSPDHPYVAEHPEWFRKRADGSIQYAENPPKKYQDIYPFDFESPDWEALWQELKSIFDFWVARGVKIFRVDNPHTKSLAFWHWCIGELKAEHPELIFLAEAFTRPKLMYLLAKAGFSQSYTYFTWRTTAYELKTYLKELHASPVCEFFRPNFWPNTPDILPEHLQHAGRPAFAVRLVLAATLSGNYGIYGPAFELLDNQPRPGAEEYLDNEKYELKHYDVEAPGSLRPLISRLNAIRRDNSALQRLGGLAFHDADNELLLCYSKVSESGDNVVLVVVNLDVHHVQAGWVRLKSNALGLDPGRALQLHDLLSDARYPAQGEHLYVRLDPNEAPAHVFRLRRHLRSEHDFDYFA